MTPVYQRIDGSYVRRRSPHDFNVMERAIWLRTWLALRGFQP